MAERSRVKREVSQPRQAKDRKPAAPTPAESSRVKVSHSGAAAASPSRGKEPPDPRGAKRGEGSRDPRGVRKGEGPPPTKPKDPTKARGEAPTKTRAQPRREPVIAAGQKRATTESKQSSLSKKVTLAEPVRSRAARPAAQQATKGGAAIKARDSQQATKKPAVKHTKETHEVPRSASRLSRDRTRTRTLSPGESRLVQQMHSQIAAQELAAAATVRQEQETEHQEDQDDYYESDFESDFESCSSSESAATSSEGDEEGEGASGPRELASLPSPAPRPLVQPQPSREPARRPQHLNIAPSTEDLGSDMRTKGQGQDVSTKSQGQKSLSQLAPAINFAMARQRQAQMQAEERARSAASAENSHAPAPLDAARFTLRGDFHSLSHKYEALMTNYGVQVQTQTGEGQLDAEEQTEDVQTCERWTQHPPCPQPDTQGLQAVGPMDEFAPPEWPKSLDLGRLERFISRAAEMVLAVLSEDTLMEPQTSVSTSLGLEELSVGGVTLGSEVSDLLVSRPASQLRFCEGPTLLTLHPDIAQQEQEDLLKQDLVMVWNTRTQIGSPRVVLGSRAPISSLMCHPQFPNLVFAATQHGGVSVWDLREGAHLHPHVTWGGRQLPVRTPTFTTALRAAGHEGVRVVSLSSLPGAQVVSVDEAGVAITWNILRTPPGQLALEQAELQPSWGGYRLALSHVTRLTEGEAEVRAAEVLRDRVLLALDTGEVLSSSLGIKQGTRNFVEPRGYTARGKSSISVCPAGLARFLVLLGEGGLQLHTAEGGSRAVWSSPSHELGDSTPVQVTWGHVGLVCLLPGHLQLWHVPHRPRPLVTCRTRGEITTISAAKSDNQLAVATRGGALHVLTVKQTLCSPRDVTAG